MIGFFNVFLFVDIFMHDWLFLFNFEKNIIVLIINLVVVRFIPTCAFIYFMEK